MAPERLLGGEVDHRADLFTIGVMLVGIDWLPTLRENYGELSHAVLHHAFHLTRSVFTRRRKLIL